MCGAAEAVQDGVTGLVVRNETASGLAVAAELILNDTSFAARVREDGPRFVKARFGYERMIDDTLVAYADAGVGWAVQFLPEDLKYRISISLTDAKRESGHCWAFHLPQLAGWADTLQNPTRSPLVVLEDGVPLGPPHSTHEAIRSKGGCRIFTRETCCISPAGTGQISQRMVAVTLPLCRARTIVDRRCSGRLGCDHCQECVR